MPVIDLYDSVKMLHSSASQYLPPDYLQPLPTTLDAKNSPLALLAQTCSSIGKDPPSKSIIPPLEKKETCSKSPNSDSSSREIKSSPVREKDIKSSSDNHRQQKPDDSERKEIRNFYPMSTSSPKLDKVQTDKQRIKDDNKKCDSDAKSQTASVRPSSSSSSGLQKINTDRSSPKPKTNEHMKDNRGSKYSPPLKGQRSESPVRQDNSPIYETKHPHSMYTGLPFGPLVYTNVPYGHGGFPPSAEVLAAAGYAYGLSGQSSYNLASAHALAAHQAALKSNSSAALAQYMQYARMRNQTGLSGCKDPYCTNCVSAAMAQNVHLPSQCTSPGCAQCSYEKTLQELGFYGLAATNPLHSPFSAPPSASIGLSHLHSLYAHNILTQGQHVCNWMIGNDYCGKRFNSPEELLQHLRTHTSGGESALSVYGALGLSIPPTDIAGVPGYSSTGANISPGTLRRLYPTSVSPLSASSLSSRYHPYKSALPNLPSGMPHQPLSSLGPYYSPYALYGQRIGSASVP